MAIPLACLAAYFAAVIASEAVADERLPVIVTYEMSKQREAARAIARQPKAFWIQQIVTAIEDKKPILPTHLKAPVTVETSFVVARDGHVLSKAITKSSGVPEVDKVALATLDRAAPFPPMPATLSETELAFRLPLRFR